MKKVASVRFENYLFNHKDFPKKSQMAILDSECMDIAREIIERENISIGKQKLREFASTL